MKLRRSSSWHTQDRDTGDKCRCCRTEVKQERSECDVTVQLFEDHLIAGKNEKTLLRYGTHTDPLFQERWFSWNGTKMYS